MSASVSAFPRFRAAMRRLLLAPVLALACLPMLGDAAAPEDRHAEARERMIDRIVATTRETARETGITLLSAGTLAAMRQVPRHRFTPDSDEAAAYQDRPLAIGLGQTISQPFIVALMTDLLHVERGQRVLEIGTGSGYQAAVLAELGAKVYTVEIVEPLGAAAARRLDELGYDSVETRIGDGYEGWPQHAPYDAIIVTAAVREIPPALLSQLKPGGRMVVPLGAPGAIQQLTLVRKTPAGAVERRPVLAVRFVPFTGKASGLR